MTDGDPLPRAEWVERFKREHPDDYEEIEAAILASPHIAPSVEAEIAQLKADKETVERALLKTWYDRRFDWCAVCTGRGVNQKPENVTHEPDCPVPPLLMRYEES